MKILFLICICLILTVITLAAEIFRMKKNQKRSETQALKMIRQIRYGQFNINLETFKNEQIKTATAKMLEALKDREAMLAEYKQILMEQNKSLEQSIEREKEAQKFKDDFIAALTHDLKTPVIAEVNTIKMFLSGTFGEISESQKEVLEMMLRSDKDLIELSEMLLQTYKYQQTEIVLSKTKTDLNGYIAEIFQDLYPILNSKQQKPLLNKPDEPVFAEIDTIHFKRVLHNLILNASKYGFADTTITISLEKQEDNAVIKVTNVGEKINPEDIELIFQKYYTGINKFSYIGTGLGLYCVNKIVKAHGGNVKVDVKDDSETTFTVIIPTESGENEQI
ncbi:MAG: HAMP domain-containing histidine kinase [Candidatus Gastranaerophilales bacterium]|nr:HAMP domain-containing histidine kinase [Candidatus Gastranaerophilales bacterium]